jgi:hypothetical protein
MHVETTQRPCGGDRPTIQQTEVAAAVVVVVVFFFFFVVVLDFVQGWMLFSVELPSVCSINSLLNSQLTVVIRNKHYGLQQLELGSSIPLYVLYKHTQSSLASTTGTRHLVLHFYISSCA